MKAMKICSAVAGISLLLPCAAFAVKHDQVVASGGGRAASVHAGPAIRSSPSVRSGPVTPSSGAPGASLNRSRSYAPGTQFIQQRSIARVPSSSHTFTTRNFSNSPRYTSHDWNRNRDHHHDSDWWKHHHHHHDNVVFINGGYYYYDSGFWYPDYYDYYTPSYTYYDTSDYYTSDNVVFDVQRELRREGYYHGPIDGVIGPGTRGAIAAYQENNGLAPTGRINRALLESLGLA